VIYYIEVQDTNRKDFLQIVQSLKNLGVIESYQSVGNLAREGEPITTDELLAVLESAQQEVAEGNIISSEEVKKQIQSWKKN